MPHNEILRRSFVQELPYSMLGIILSVPFAFYFILNLYIFFSFFLSFFFLFHFFFSQTRASAAYTRTLKVEIIILRRATR